MVSDNLWQAGVIVTLDSQGRAAIELDQLGNSLEYPVDVGCCHLRDDVRAQHAINQSGQSVCFLDNDIGEFLQIFGREFPLQQPG